MPADLAPGDLVQVTGRVEERRGVTGLTAIESITVCRSGSALAATPLSLRATDDLEPYEGMLVTVVEELTVANTYELRRFGQLLVAPGERPFHAGNSRPAAPGGAGRRLLVDDGSRVENPATPPYLDPSGTRRLGTRITGLTGIVSEEQSSHVLHPTRRPRFDDANPRPAAPPAVGGNLQVASFNVHNFFTTLGQRGATDAVELARQRDKIVAALLAVDADIVGLCELENNGDVAIGALVAALNAEAGRGGEAPPADRVWAHVPAPAGGFGDDAIRVGLIYRPASARPVGDARVDRDPVFRRPPLTQTFEVGGDRLTVVVNHFKSKRCGAATGAEKDAGDGQGCWNTLRSRQARRLLAIVAQLAAAGDSGVLVLGDLNAYGAEDPIRVLTDGGLVDQVAAHVALGERYSYAYKGEIGYLDHALTTASLSRRVTGVAIWHINADEPPFLDYRSEWNPPRLYRPGPYRSSDHDPVVIGFEY